MSALEQAIKDAVDKGGYRRRNQRWDGISSEDSRLPSVSQNAILLDADFWSSLDKARGWEASVCKLCGEIGFCDHANCPRILPWKYHWHRLIDSLASGGTIEEFFSSLL